MHLGTHIDPRRDPSWCLVLAIAGLSACSPDRALVLKQNEWVKTNFEWREHMVTSDIDVTAEGYLLVASRFGAFMSRDLGESFELITEEMSIGIVAADPSDARHVLITTGGGLLQTRDLGATWSPVTGPNTMYCQGIAFDPRNTKTVYCTWPVMTLPPTGVPGLYRSDDGGDTWTRVNSDLFEAVTVGADGKVFATAEGVWVSADRGKRFDKISAGAASGSVADFRFVVVDAEDGGTIVSGGQSGLFMSHDSGKSWTRSDPGTPLNPRCAKIFAHGAKSSGQPGTLWLAVNAVGVLSSADGGSTWQTVNAGLGRESACQVTPLRIAISPASPRVAYVLDDQVWVYQM